MASAACTAAAALAPEASAFARINTPLPGEVIVRACSGNAGRPISRVRLAEAIVIQAGKAPSEFVGGVPEAVPTGTSIADAYGQALVERLGKIGAGAEPETADNAYLLQSTVETLEAALLRQKPGQKGPLTIEGERPTEAPFLFQSPQPGWTLRCAEEDEGRTFVADYEDFDRLPSFALRSRPEELSLTGTQRRSAGALALAYDRTRSTLDDGSRKTETNLAVSGTAGVRLSGRDAQKGSAFGYARYELKQGRTRPAPALAPGASQSDGDTHALETGFLVSAQLTRNEDDFKIFLDAQASDVWDFANDARRLRLKTTVRLVPIGTLGICGLGRFQPLIPQIGLKTKCQFQLEVEGAGVLKRGTTKLGSYDSFLAAGGRADFQAFLPTADGMGFVGELSYRYLPVIHGPPADIKRLEASLKHRFWTARDIGVDVGFNYTRGTNELSFEKENVFSFGLGIIY
jgi:hypothetical protein